ncbi:MAG: phosphoribosylformimino-5-aminoimidazole carboxamide ribotide isomerase [Actinomycetota bacterium]|jgi:phosphoribosylformimino-5-aminoimidazole carboxamide ribotide isomerase|nr:phosphoribosylformimino-5-aminoimidazole carboxamide ribotide isomerase [Actinomycetota bacterium]
MKFTVYPAVDISDGRCVRLLQGRFGSETVYSDDPVKVALGLASAGARWLHIVDLDGAKTGIRANRELVLEVVKRASCPVQAGGGLRSLDDVEEIIAAGANRAVLGTVALEDPDEMARACKRYGERIAVSLDARSGELATHGWTVGSGVPVEDAVKAFAEAGVSLFIYTDVSRDGAMTGPDVEGLQRLTELTDVPVVASGGVASLDDVRTIAALQNDGVSGVIVGRALYEGKFTIGQANFAADGLRGANLE